MDDSKISTNNHVLLEWFDEKNSSFVQELVYIRSYMAFLKSESLTATYESWIKIIYPNAQVVVLNTNLFIDFSNLEDKLEFMLTYG